MFTASRSGKIDKKLDLIDVSARVVLVRVGASIAQSMQRKLIEGNKVASGALVRSFTVTPAELISGTMKVRIGPSVPYGPAVHFGTPPGGKQPPSETIRAWMKMKGIQVVPRGKESQEKAERRVSFMIARKIAVRGIPPFPFMKSGFGFNRGEAIAQLRREMSLMLKVLRET